MSAIKLSCLRTLAVLICASSATVVAHAQEVESISSERPTVGYSADMLPAGSFQVENGLGLSLQRHGYTSDLPESYFRYAVTAAIEVTYQPTDMMYQPSGDPTVSNFQGMDGNVGIKFRISGHNNSFMPKTGILGMDTPTGGVSETSGSHDPNVCLIWLQALGHGYLLNENVGGTLTTLNTARRFNWANNISVSKSLSRTLSAYVEYAPNLAPENIFTYEIDGGIAILHGPRQQFDIGGGFFTDSLGLHTAITAGYSVRYDNFFARAGRPH